MPVIMPSLQGFTRNPDGSYSVTEKRADYGKITGTQISGLLGLNPWQTPFSTACKMMRLFNEDISDKPSVHAGVVMEPKILDYIGAVHGDDVFAKREGDHETWASDFDNEIFGGHVDGFMPDGSIVEVKTSSRPQDWDGKIPLHYHIQASLYAKFFNTDKIVFAVGFTDRNTLADPDAWMPNKNNTIIVETGIIAGLDDMMQVAEDIYRKTVLNGVTPVPNPATPIDSQICGYLDAQLWEEDGIRNVLQYVSELNDDIERLKELQTELEDQKTRLALYMDYNGVTDVECDSVSAKRVTATRTSIDSAQLKKDGLYKLYAKEKEYRSLKINKKK